MKEQAIPVGEAPTSKTCPQCGGTAVAIGPVKQLPKDKVVYNCRACKYMFDFENRAFINSTKGLQDVFRAASLGKQTLLESLAGRQVSPATKALLTAQILEYGIQMWYDGCKQGLLLALQEPVTPNKETKNDDGKTGDR